MISYTFDHTDFHSLLRDLATKLGTNPDRDVLVVPPGLGTGSLRAIRLPNGLSVCVADLSMNADISLHRKKREPSFYILAFDEIYIHTRLEHVIGDEQARQAPPVYAAANLHSTLFDVTTIASRGCRIRNVRIIFDPRWLQKYFGIDREDEVLARYISLKAKKLLMEPLDADYRKYLDDIFDADPDDPVYFAAMENRVMMLMERFFNRIIDKMEGVGNIRIDAREIQAMMELEAELTSEGLQRPPAVEDLAARFGMGQTKLKKLFRDIYGYPLYEYFQRHRMEKARAMLLSGEHSVKEVGYGLGYKSLSNFARAFKQVFNYLPSDLVRTRKYAG